MRAKDIMTETVISVTPDNGIRHAARLMLDHHVSGLPVIGDDGRLAGMLTEGDLLARSELGTAATAGASAAVDLSAADYIRSHSWRVGDVMSTTVVTVDEHIEIGRLATVLRTNGIKRVPVLHDGRMVGIVSRADILQALIVAPRDNAASGDEAIQRAVSTRLHHELKLDPVRVTVTASDGNVHLSGHVASETERKAALVATETVEGVRGVVNNLHVADPAPPTG